MKMQNICFLFVTMFVLSTLACDSGPRVIESESDPGASEIPAFNVDPSANNNSSSKHKVLVKEVLNTDKYTYLNVTENNENFWIAIQKREVAVGDTYFYNGGLLKKNFFSQEFDRTFETVYLVSDVWKEPSASLSDEPHSKTGGAESNDLEVGNIQPAEGAITISELVSNKEKYNGKTIKITGKCIKVNPMIMDRNWIHIKDSSTDDVDMTVTTAENVPLGAVVTLEGTISLDRDFGAGYRYDIIMESAVLK